MRILRQVQARRPLLDAAQHEVPDCIQANRSQLAGLAHRRGNVLESEVLQSSQYPHVLALAWLSQPCLEQTSQARELFGQLPARQRGRLIERVGLAFQQC